MTTLLDIFRRKGLRTAREMFEGLCPREQAALRKRFGCSCTTTDLVQGPHHDAHCGRWQLAS